jgi:uncharacterized surface protein with fasciclin (FAS1) repeats
MTKSLLSTFAERHGLHLPDPTAIGRVYSTGEPIQGTGTSDLLLGSAEDDRIFGRGGADLIFGGRGNDRILGGTESDAIVGGAGDDSLGGQAGDDVLLGGGGNDLLSGGNGRDILIGGSGADALNGDGGDDRLDGGAGDDRLDGGVGSDVLRGGAGNDRLLGKGGDDDLAGGKGDDLLAGGAGHDVLSGDAGRDVLIGSSGNDSLTGGEGPDLFRFNPNNPNEGFDTITDFTLGEDKIVLDVADVLASTPGLAKAIIGGGGTVAAVLTALDNASDDWFLNQNGAGDLVIQHPTGEITLEGIPAAQVDSFFDLADALVVDGLGETLVSVAEASGQPATIAAVVAESGGTPDDNPEDFDLLLSALEATGLTGVLADPEASFTVFAPNDAAFISFAQRLGFAGSDEAGALAAIIAVAEDLGGGDPVPVLTDVLTYHVVGGAETLGELQAGGTIQPLFADADLDLIGTEVDDADPDLANAEIIAPDIITGNGVIHVVNEVLLPFDL